MYCFYFSNDALHRDAFRNLLSLSNVVAPGADDNLHHPISALRALKDLGKAIGAADGGAAFRK